MSDGDSDAEDRPYIAWDEGSDRLVVNLPHQCSEWVIGGPEEVREMIHALEALLPEFKRPDAYRHTHACPRCGAVCYRASRQCEAYCGGRDAAWVCSACFYPAQDERRSACQAARHPERACQMPWCWTCSWCQHGCLCKQAAHESARTFPPTSMASTFPGGAMI